MSDLHEPTGDEDLPMPPAEGDGLFGAPPPEAKAPQAADPTRLIPDTYRVLARKYRPRTFDDLIGQDAMVRVLRRAFATGRVAHAFMLTGVRGVGKTTTARIIARALACVGPDGTGGPTVDPCGVCPNCVAILADRHPDVLELDAASRTGIDDIREIIDATRYRPMQARAKVFIIDEVHMLSRNAFNALLKTLEEPPPHVTFIFATTELRKVPVTVLSRCQRFDLRRVAQSVLTDHFRRIAGVEGFEVSDAALEMIARAADGSVRDGLSLLDQALAYAAIEDGAIAASTVADMLGLADRTMLFDLMEAVMGGRPADALGLLGRAHADGADPGQVLTDLLELVHVLTRIKSIPGLAQGAELPELERTRGAALAERLGIAALGRAWQILLKGIGEIELAPNRQSAAEMVLIRLCFLADLPPPAELVRRLGAQGSAHPAAPAASAPAASAPAGSAAAPRAASPPPPPRGQGGALARAIPLDEPAPERSAPQPTSWREIVAVVAASGREPLLHGYLRNAVHPLRVAPGVVEIRQLPGTPRDLAGRLAAVLRAETGVRWTVALGTERGEPTLDEQSDAIREASRADIEQHPLIVEILRLFPGARIGDVADDRLDAYGLPAAAERLPILGGEADIPPFAPVDAEFASDVMPADPEDVQSDPWESRR